MRATNLLAVSSQGAACLHAGGCFPVDTVLHQKLLEHGMVLPMKFGAFFQGHKLSMVLVVLDFPKIGKKGHLFSRGDGRGEESPFRAADTFRSGRRKVLQQSARQFFLLGMIQETADKLDRLLGARIQFHGFFADLPQLLETDTLEEKQAGELPRRAHETDGGWVLGARSLVEINVVARFDAVLVELSVDGSFDVVAQTLDLVVSHDGYFFVVWRKSCARVLCCCDL